LAALKTARGSLKFSRLLADWPAAAGAADAPLLSLLPDPVPALGLAAPAARMGLLPPVEKREASVGVAAAVGRPPDVAGLCGEMGMRGLSLDEAKGSRDCAAWAGSADAAPRTWRSTRWR
jgi:hypothetical protein